ncbi:MAG: ATP-binding protein, partial [Bdellovibrionota bacterium]
LEPPPWIDAYLVSQLELLAIDAVEYYPDILDQRLISQRAFPGESELLFQRYAQDLLVRAYGGEKVSVTQHVGSGDLIRTLVPVHLFGGSHGLAAAGIVSVGMYIPVSLVNKVDEIANVFDDYKDVNPLKYPMKTTYFIILIMITLVIIFVAIWIGLYMARELTVPVERLVYGAQAVGGGNLDVTISGSGHDEIAVLVESFNKMTRDLRENRERLIQASSDIEKRQRELEAILANVGTGVIAVDKSGKITTLNRAASHLFEVQAQDWVGKSYNETLIGDREPLKELIDRAFWASERDRSEHAETSQWNTSSSTNPRSLAAISTPLYARESALEAVGSFLGIVVVIDDLTHLIKAQREMAWREVARRIAHEIKNPLTPIKLSAQRLQRKLGDYAGKDSQLLKECTDTIIQHTDELKEMVNEFSSFARFPEISPSMSDLNEVLREVISLFSAGHADIQMKVELEQKLPNFDFDRDQIKRVVINLLDNAVAALGAVPLSPSNPRKIRVATHFNEQLGIAALEVEDNGAGMDDDVKARVFEPYFSTKKEGTGLGLAIVKRIINDHDGFIRVYSTPDKGTQFLIELPLGPKKRPQRHDDRPAV